MEPGIKVISTPGHTNEDASLLIETAEGNYALTHLWWWPNCYPEEDPLAEDPHGIKKSRELVLGQDDWIVPGHGAAFKSLHRKPVGASKEQKKLSK